EQIDTGLTIVGRAGGRLAVVYIDLDDFKRINDEHGHDGGDRVLTEVAARLRANLRPNDAAARLGGDEFVCVLKYLSADEDTAAAVGDGDAGGGRHRRAAISIGVHLAVAVAGQGEPAELGVGAEPVRGELVVGEPG